MALLSLTKVLEDRVNSNEKRFDEELKSLEAKMDRNFKINIVIACISLLPAMQACGVPTKVVVPILLKALLGQ